MNVNTKIVQTEAIRLAYLRGYEDASKMTSRTLSYGDGRMKYYYDAGFRFGEIMRREAETLAEHYSRGYLEPFDTTKTTERPPSSFTQLQHSPKKCSTSNCSEVASRNLGIAPLCESCYQGALSDD